MREGLGQQSLAICLQPLVVATLGLRLWENSAPLLHRNHSCDLSLTRTKRSFSHWHCTMPFCQIRAEEYIEGELKNKYEIADGQS